MNDEGNKAVNSGYSESCIVDAVQDSGRISLGTELIGYPSLFCIMYISVVVSRIGRHVSMSVLSSGVVDVCDICDNKLLFIYIDQSDATETNHGLLLLTGVQPAISFNELTATGALSPRPESGIEPNCDHVGW